jgi:hypothetical protein
MFKNLSFLRLSAQYSVVIRSRVDETEKGLAHYFSTHLLQLIIKTKGI